MLAIRTPSLFSLHSSQKTRETGQPTIVRVIEYSSLQRFSILTLLLFTYSQHAICYSLTVSYIICSTVSVAQLAEHQIVALRVAGSSPVAHPKTSGHPYRCPFVVSANCATTMACHTRVLIMNRESISVNRESRIDNWESMIGNYGRGKAGPARVATFRRRSDASPSRRATHPLTSPRRVSVLWPPTHT
jgi:hypothetical protein